MTACLWPKPTLFSALINLCLPIAFLSSLASSSHPQTLAIEDTWSNLAQGYSNVNLNCKEIFSFSESACIFTSLVSWDTGESYLHHCSKKTMHSWWQLHRSILPIVVRIHWVALFWCTMKSSSSNSYNSCCKFCTKKSCKNYTKYPCPAHWVWAISVWSPPPSLGHVQNHILKEMEQETLKLDRAHKLLFCHICSKGTCCVGVSHEKWKYLKWVLVPTFSNMKSWPLWCI